MDKKAEREITETRVINAPRELVFRMWTDPERIVRWWGPKGFTTTIREMDVRPGGYWRFVMHGPDGGDYRNEIIYREVISPELLVYDHISGPHFHARVTFADHGNGTSLTVRMLFGSADEKENVIRVFNAAQGLKETIGRLESVSEEYISQELHGRSG